ncbi:putative esterase [Pantoea sp. AS-PWVM4]|uniref:esterase n=1 Tax=Pantoea sp. AS-PWVM4 TaxID=1332069 RepID=UPI0003AC7C0C|nr:esterase [Pantoea sp. AS-PWVM4]ERK16310.1 putative esterase [Pantoea sp. AS-PWVM4]
MNQTKVRGIVLRSLAVMISAVLCHQAFADLPQPANDPHAQVHDGGKGGQHKWVQPPQPFKVLPDNKVVFSIRAPEASKVEVQGGWPGGAKGDSRVAMTKGADGVWTTTVGPLASDIWNYQFIVDGVKAMPEFGRKSPRTGLANNEFAIPGAKADDFVANSASKGSVTYTSVPYMDSQKRFTIYTPPGYFNSSERYPVLYLTLGGAHDGSRANEDSFIFNLLDNMIADKRIQPMIVVVLDPDAPGGSSLGNSSFHGGGNQTSEKYVEASQAIVDNIVPFVDKSFRTLADREHRAIGGFSSPGAQGFMAGARNPNVFASIGTFSGGFPTWPGVGVQIESKLHYDHYTGPDLNRVPDMKKLGAYIPELNSDANMKLVFMSVGSDEPLIQTFELMKTFLSERGIKYQAIVEPGEIHDGRNIRVSLRNFLPLLFK